jgi:undecaprenyl-diphosphatase
MHVDVELFRRIYGAQGLWLWTMCALTILGSGWTMIPIASLAAFERTRAHAIRLLGVLCVVALAVVMLKLAIGRARPCASLADVHALVFSAPTDPSCPSGHAAGAFAVAAFVAFEARVHVAAKFGVFVVAAAIALSRIVLGVHFPSDVIAGALLGVFIAWIVRKSFAKKIRNEMGPDRIS